MNAGLWSGVYVWSGIFETFYENFVMFVNEEVCEIILIISSSTDYEFSTAFFIFKALMWSVYYYHKMLADIGREENYKRLVAYGFHSWQINWYLTPRGEKLWKLLLRIDCFQFVLDSLLILALTND